jgi:hypothetical protein
MEGFYRHLSVQRSNTPVCHGMIGQRIDWILVVVAKPTRALLPIPSSTTSSSHDSGKTAHNKHGSTVVERLIRDFLQRPVI